MHLSALHAEVRSLLRRDAVAAFSPSAARELELLSVSERVALRILRRRLRRAGNESARVLPEASSTVWTVSPRSQTAE